MSELSNTVSASGIYNNVTTLLTSNTSLVNLVDELVLNMSANKKNWSDGNLIYTIEVINQSEKKHNDVIDTSLVNFIIGSVKINNVLANDGQYSYDLDKHMLTINLDDVLGTSKVVISFSVKKRFNDPFVLNNYCSATYEDEMVVNSNNVKVIGIGKVYPVDCYKCSTPHWR